MPITTVKADDSAIVYNDYRMEGNKFTYIGPTHSDVAKQQLILTSASPKRSSDSYGNRRSSLNNVITVAVTDPQGQTTNKDMKLELLASVPVGATFAQFQEQLAAVADLASNDSFAQALFLTGQIDH